MREPNKRDLTDFLRRMGRLEIQDFDMLGPVTVARSPYVLEIFMENFILNCDRNYSEILNDP